MHLNEGSQSLYKSERGRGTSEGWEEVQREVELEEFEKCPSIQSLSSPGDRVGTSLLV